MVLKKIDKEQVVLFGMLVAVGVTIAAIVIYMLS